MPTDPDMTPAAPPSAATAPLRPARRRRSHACAAGLGALAWASAAALAAGQAPTIVPITSEPSHHPALANDHVRVFDVTAAPHASTLIHRHDHDYIFVTLGDADITSTRTDAPAARLHLRDGAIEYARGGFAHSVTDNGDRPFHNITIELLQPAADVVTCSADCTRSAPCAAEVPCAVVTRAMTASDWVVDSVALPPHATWTADRAWTPRLVVLVTPADLELRGEYESSTGRHRLPGNLIWLPDRQRRRTLPGGAVMERATPALTNVGDRPVRFVVLAWKKA